MKPILCLPVLFLGAITGCSLQSREAEPKNAYLLDVNGLPATPVAWPAAVQIHPCRSITSLAGTPLVYRLSRVRYERDPFNLFLVPPTEQIDDLLAQRLADKASAGTPSVSTPRQWRLEPTLERLWGDFTDPNQARAEVQMHFLMTEQLTDSRVRRILLDARFHARRELPAAPSAEDLVTQLSRCLAEVLTQLEAALLDRIKALENAPVSSAP
jgi:hypothetical protein